MTAIFKDYSQFIWIDHCFQILSTLVCGAALVSWAYSYRDRASSIGGDVGDDSSIVKEVDVQSLATEDEPSDDSDIEDEDVDNKSQQPSSSPASSSAHPKTNTSNKNSSNKCPTREKARAQGLILYNKHWYDVYKFIPHHPGGSEILKQYLGTDITHVFHVMHRDPNQIMKYRKPVREATEEEMKELLQRREDVCQEMFNVYEEGVMTKSHAVDFLDRKQFNLEAFEKDAGELYDEFMKAGYTKPTLFWLVQKTALVLMFLFLSIVCMQLASSDGQEQSSSSIIATRPLSYILPGIFLGLFWHQSGFLMHDAEHHNLIGNERVNDILGWVYGTVFLGVNGAWWREEHREHHAMLNSFDDDGFKDPQVRVCCIVVLL
jgi:delta8-fatty-acid desaturase